MKDPGTHAAIGAAMEAYRELGPGFLERVYQEALSLELSQRQAPHLREVELPIFYKGDRLGTAYRADFVCYDEVLIELKAQKSVGEIEAAQLINYLQAVRKSIGLLLNFGTPSLGYKRYIRSPKSATSA